jgi:hypothetical protein
MVFEPPLIPTGGGFGNPLGTLGVDGTLGVAWPPPSGQMGVARPHPRCQGGGQAPLGAKGGGFLSFFFDFFFRNKKFNYVATPSVKFSFVYVSVR